MTTSSIWRIAWLAGLGALLVTVAALAGACAPTTSPGTTLPTTVTTATSGAPTTAATSAPTPTTATGQAATTVTIPDSTTTSVDAAFSTFAAPEPGQLVNALVVDVVDGDTLVVVLHLGEGLREEVRLIGIDAPESGEDFADQATQALEKLTSKYGPEVRLEIGEEMRDQYGRLLAYVYKGAEPPGRDLFINAELLRLGLATVFTVEPNGKYAGALQQAQNEAQAATAGMWAATKPSPLEIVRVEYDPPGDDTLDLNAEYIVLRVLVAGNLDGYAIEDESGKRFDFPSRVYQTRQTITLHSGHGTNTTADLYWGVSGSAIWNNGGDTVKVLDPQGHIVANYDY